MPVSTTPSHYDILKVAETAAPEEIKQAFRKRARETHPDTNGLASESVFVAVTEAYDILSVPAKRQAYDDELAAGGRETEEQAQREAEFNANFGGAFNGSATQEQQEQQEARERVASEAKEAAERVRAHERAERKRAKAKAQKAAEEAEEAEKAAKRKARKKAKEKARKAREKEQARARAARRALLGRLGLAVAVVGLGLGFAVREITYRSPATISREAAEARIAQLAFHCIQPASCQEVRAGENVALTISNMDKNLVDYLDAHGYSDSWSDNQHSIHAQAIGKVPCPGLCSGAGWEFSYLTDNGRALMYDSKNAYGSGAIAPPAIVSNDHWTITWQLRSAAGRVVKRLRFSIKIVDCETEEAACRRREVYDTDRHEALLATYSKPLSRHQMERTIVFHATAAHESTLGYEYEHYEHHKLPPLFPYTS